MQTINIIFDNFFYRVKVLTRYNEKNELFPSTWAFSAAKQ